MEGFTVVEACRLTGCTSHQLRYWDQVGLVTPSVQETGGRPGVRRLYSFRDLVALRVIKALLNEGLSLQKIRRAYDYLRRKANLEGHLEEVKLITDRTSIFHVTSNDELLDALRQGQLAFYETIEGVTKNLHPGVAEYLRDRDQFIQTINQAEDTLMGEAGSGQ